MVARSARFTAFAERLPLLEDDGEGAGRACLLREESKDTGTPLIQERHSQRRSSTHTMRTGFPTPDGAGTHGLLRQALTEPHFSEFAPKAVAARFL